MMKSSQGLHQNNHLLLLLFFFFINVIGTSYSSSIDLETPNCSNDPVNDFLGKMYEEHFREPFEALRDTERRKEFLSGLSETSLNTVTTDESGLLCFAHELKIGDCTVKFRTPSFQDAVLKIVNNIANLEKANVKSLPPAVLAPLLKDECICSNIEISDGCLFKKVFKLLQLLC